MYKTALAPPQHQICYKLISLIMFFLLHIAHSFVEQDAVCHLKSYTMATNQLPALMSVRASTAMERSCSFLAGGTDMCRDNPFDAETNPQGMINMGTSNNFLMQEEILKKLSDPSLLQYDHTMLKYNDPTGHPSLRSAIADFLTERANAAEPLDPNKVIVMNGATPCIDSLAYCIGDPHDAFLCPTPYYGFILRDVGLRSQMELFHVHLSSKPRPGETQPFQLTVERLEEALQQAKDQNIKVRGLFLMNPHNPLGDVYTQTQIMDLLQFCKRHHLHVVIDEIYLCSIFGEGVQHSSIFRLKTEEIPDPERTHFIWSFSKDFGMAGQSCGLIYTWNKEMHKILRTIAPFHRVSAFTQHALAKMLKDKEFLDNIYFPTYHQRLRESHKMVTDKLTELGIPYLHRHAGLFVWADLSQFLSDQTPEAEHRLYQLFVKNNIYIRPSVGFYGNELGWFRICFSQRKETIKVGMERISEVCKQVSKVPVSG